MKRSALPGVLALAALVTGCSTPDPDARTNPVGPDRASFGPVAQMLGRRCGTLDCHGETHRNLRLYGYGGLRLDATTLPEADITDAEIDADYDAVIALEPEKMADLVREGGFAPERLTLVRKARGAEDHKGGNPIIVGDDADKCLVTWLASTTDIAACQRTLTQR